MKCPLVFFQDFVCNESDQREMRARSRRQNRIRRFTTAFALIAFSACISLAPGAFAQIQSTTSCPAGHGYWDILSVMMMDPGLASAYHMEGITNGLPSSYVYTLWERGENKVYYTKNPQGNPWDINLYDSNFIYQWITELQEWDGVNHWNDPTSCRKFNNGSDTNLSDRSMRWAARCATPGSPNSSFWNPPPSTQPHNTNYYTYVGQKLEPPAQNLGYSLLQITSPESISIFDHRAVPPAEFSATTLPLVYTYSCGVSGNVNSCQSREIFEYAFDSDVNPVDKVKHSYGWVRWRLYSNSKAGNPKVAAVWVLKNTTTSNHLMSGQVEPNFQCF
jgi:hypothetical protein